MLLAEEQTREVCELYEKMFNNLKNIWESNTKKEDVCGKF